MMDLCPAEVLHNICSCVEPKDVASWRLVNKQFGDIGAHYIMGDGLITFHCSPQSLRAVESISRHPILSLYVKKILYEANILGPVMDSREYKRIFFPGEPSGPPPKRPQEDCSPRERRLYERNMQKWRQGNTEIPSGKKLDAMFQDYCREYDAQQWTLRGRIDVAILKDAISRFPKLIDISLSNTGRCRHALSRRFFARFPKGFQPPMEYDSKHTVRQIGSLLPAAEGFPPSFKLQTFKASAISPKVFSNSPVKDNLVACFAYLKKLDLTFRLEEIDAVELDYMEIKSVYRSIKKGNLREALVHATLLEDLSISFNDYGEYHGCCADITDVLGEYSWPKLQSLSLSALICNSNDFLQALKRQPMLKHLGLSLTTLTSGSWADVLEKMRKQLNLQSTDFGAFLASRSPADEFMVMDHVDADAYYDDPEALFTLSDAIDTYLCHMCGLDEEEDADDYMNPVRRLEDYLPYEDLVDEGDMMDLDDISDFDGDDSDDNDDHHHHHHNHHHNHHHHHN